MDRAGIAGEPSGRQHLDDFVVRHKGATIGKEQPKQIGLGLCEAHDTFRRSRQLGVEVYRHVAHGLATAFGGAVTVGGRSFDGTLDARHKACLADRLRHIIVSAEAEAANLVGLIGLDGQEQDGRQRIYAADLLTDRKAVASRHHDIEQHKIGTPFSEERQRLEKQVA